VKTNAPHHTFGLIDGMSRDVHDTNAGPDGTQATLRALPSPGIVCDFPEEPFYRRERGYDCSECNP